jgi:flagellar hook protein FlgE
MSIWSSLYTGSSGLSAHGDAISIVGDNIANVSTVGFKGSRASFKDVLGGRGANGSPMGAGVRMGGPDTQFGQGSFLSTGASLDFAIHGNGFFMVDGPVNGQDGSFYTRDGRFHLDDEGFVVNSDNLRLQGYNIDETGQLQTATGDLELGGQSPPLATSALDMAANLDASDPVPAPWDPTDPAGTSNYSTSVTVYDSLGTSHRVDMYFRNNGGGSWEWHAMVDGGELTGGTPGVPTEIADGTLSFTTNGELDVETTNASSADFVGAVQGQAIAFDFGDSITTDGGTGLAGTTQFAAPFSINSLEQDGYASGELVDVLVAEDGTITGLYSNGQSRPVAQLALANFQSEHGLDRAGNQLFSATASSGEALVGQAGTGTRGAIYSGMLEGSNVDLSNELVNLIGYQRAFQSNARTVSTADEMLAEIANLKR